jgi:NCS1 family nucleobase:cation symporter-1
MATTVGESGVPGSVSGVDGAEIFRGNRPQRHGDRSLETQGMSPIPEDQRYGAAWRNFTVWFAPNMELSGVFTGTLAFTLGLGFWPGFIAIVLGVTLGALPVALLATWGPQTGMGQLPLARLPFGKTISVPAAVQWLSSVAWDALVGIFGGEAAQLLFHVPFFLGVIIVLALQGAIGFLGYEYIHQIEKWGAVILAVLFAVLSVKILQQGNIPTNNTVSGGAAVGAFILMTTIALSGSFSWASYAADYSRYMKKDSKPQPIFLWTFAGLAASYIWMYSIGLAGAKVLVDQTAGGVQTLVGGGIIGVLALIAIIFGAITGNAMNDYSGSLAIQAAGVKIRRHWMAFAGTVLAFGLIMWLNSGNLSGKFQNVLLFTAYWLAPFLAIILIDWYMRGGRVSREGLARLMEYRNLSLGWPALAALVIGFGAMVPFMNTGLLVGPIASALQGADLSFYVGFVVAGIVYFVLRRVSDSREPAAGEVAA